MIVIKAILILLLFLHPTDGTLLESGSAETMRNKPTLTSEIKIVTYNIRWRSGEELKLLMELFRTDPEIGGAAILALQEVDRSKKRTGNSNTVKMIADELGLHYAWAAPPAPKPTDEEETGVAILSIYPLSDVRRIVLPHAGPNQRRRVALGATVEIHGRKLRVYSAHTETRLDFTKKLDQFKAMLDDLARFEPEMPAIIMGDLNTWEAKAGAKTAKLFSEAGWTTPFDGQATFRRRVLLMPIKFKLDWVWLRGLEAVNFGIDRTIKVSDHWPLWTNIKISTPPKNISGQ